MKKLIARTALLLLVPMSASAQDVDHQYHGEGYLFVADEATVGPAGGGGGEVFLYKGLGVGGEFVKAGSPFGEIMVSANAYFCVPSTKKNKFEPFVTGGYTLFYVPGVGLPHADGWNIGAGANIWLTKHAALRLEGRATHGGRDISIDYEPWGNSYTAPQNVFSFRIGVTFR